MTEQANGQAIQRAPQSWANRLVTFAEIFTLYTALMYGLTWLFYATFYDSLGVNPEDVGISVDFYLVRIAFFSFVVALALALLYLVSARVGFLMLLTEPDQDPVHRLFRVVFIALFLGIFTAIGLRFLVTKPWRDGFSLGDLLSIAVQAGGTVILMILIFWLAGYRREDMRPAGSDKVALLAVIFIVLTAVLAIGVYQAGRRTADYVVDDEEIQSPFLRVTRVRVHALESFFQGRNQDVIDSVETESVCLLQLGASDTMVVFVKPTGGGSFDLVELPMDGVQIETGTC